MPKLNFKKIARRLLLGKSDDEPDYKLMAVIGFLVAFGLIALSSAGAAVGWQNFGDSYWHVKHQLVFGLLPGMVLFLFFYHFDYRHLKKLAMPLLVISMVLLFLVFIPGIGVEYGTARSWLNIFGFSVQPSEIVKLTFLLYLAAWLSSKGEKNVRDFNYGFLPFVFILFLIVVLMVMQPDFGTMSIIVVMSLIVYFIAGGRIIHLLWMSVVGAGALALMIKISPYRLARLNTFLHPELDPEGRGYHINQALLAIGSGGWFGRGFGASRQKFAYLPEVTGDSIFAIVAEELGFVVAALVILAFVYLAIRGIQIMRSAKDPFARLLVVGIISWFIVQAFFNIGAMIGVLPLTGVPLPFISYGGTALVMCLAASGILVNISRQHPIR